MIKLNIAQQGLEVKKFFTYRQLFFNNMQKHLLCSGIKMTFL